MKHIQYMYSLIYIFISISCSNYDRCYIGCYQSNNKLTKLCLNSDSSAFIQYGSRNNRSNGLWRQSGKYIVLDFPPDTATYSEGDISRYLTSGIVVEKKSIIMKIKGGNKLLWLNVGPLIKQKDSGKTKRQHSDKIHREK